MSSPDFTPTKFRKPRTGEQKLQVQFRNGRSSIQTYTVAQLRWTDEGHDWDIIGVRKA